MTIGNILRDAVYSRLVAAPSFDWKMTRKVPVPPFQSEHLPALGVYMVREEFGPDGDANTGPVRFMVDAMIGVAILDLHSKPEILDGKMDTTIEQALDAVLTDPTFFIVTDTLGTPIQPSIEKILRTTDYPKEGETQYALGRLQITLRYYTIFPPVLKNDLQEIATTVRPPGQPNPVGQAPQHPADFLQTFETTLPQVAITTIGGNTSTANQTITGTALQGSASAALGTLYLYDVGVLPIGSATIDVNGNWSVSVTLSGLGQHVLTAAVQDALGMVGVSAPVTINLWS